MVDFDRSSGAKDTLSIVMKGLKGNDTTCTCRTVLTVPNQIGDYKHCFQVYMKDLHYNNSLIPKFE